MRIGVHVSIAGGLDKAPERGRELRCEVIQIFTRSNLQWQVRPVHHSQLERFLSLCRQFGIGPNIGHASYLLNLASPDRRLWERSVRTLAQEVQRAESLSLVCLAVHPGSHRGAGIDFGLRRVADALREVLLATAGCTSKIALETTAGSGDSIGGRFEELAEILHRCKDSPRLAVCFDTCHVFAAGYDLKSPEGYERTLEEFDRTVGLGRLCAFHLNDSRGGFASRVDRHEHIGRGTLGRPAFARLLRDPRFRHLPAVLETPKEMRNGIHWDVINLRTLRSLRGKHATPAAE